MKYDAQNWQSLTEAERWMIENALVWFSGLPPQPKSMTDGEIVELYLKENSLTVEDFTGAEFPLKLIKQAKRLEV